MATPSPSIDSTISLMRAIDGSHLKWSDFRTVVLSAFRITLNETIQLSELSRPFTDRLKVALQGLDRFSHQQRQWRSQVENGNAFGPTMLFPPNVLPPIGIHPALHRCLIPKLSREALPPRAVRARDSLFELPAPRPGLLTGFSTSAFNDRELASLPSSSSATGTIVDFSAGTVIPGATAYCPFLVFERMRIVSDDNIQSTRNQCAIAGAHCVRALQILFKRCCGPRPALDKPIAFSCAIDSSTALINYHSTDNDGRYYMSEISRFNLEDSDSFNEFQGWIEAIEEWGSTYLLPVIKVALQQHLRGNFTPPISPMPSLTLSIDTAAGGEEIIMKILRSTFGSIKWKCEGEYETPLNSSIAHCGTPFGARKIRTMALSPTESIEMASAISAGRHGPFSGWRMKADIGPRSPMSRKHHPLSPLKLKHDFPESPVRRLTLSPCTPPPEAPWTAKSPMLVLQRRMDLAMDEIQELRTLVQTLQKELATKNVIPSGQPEPARKQARQLHHYDSDSIMTPTAPTLTSPIGWEESLDRAFAVQAYEKSNKPESQYQQNLVLPGVYALFFFLSWLTGHGLRQPLMNVMLTFLTWSMAGFMYEQADLLF
ncbi:hypothetical protein LTR84_003225 [Exophiala bonariae]|uniref:DUF7924 domain-containing protein n=1 Tax=Exophiala bonariae TaxID=1690606 RepID=A0AAV9N821_9EURO|nr:hypothetical protein LTR84_003225 [Exophiala bonariae]